MSYKDTKKNWLFQQIFHIWNVFSEKLLSVGKFIHVNKKNPS